MSMSSSGTVQLTANQMRQFGVTFGGVEERTLENTVRTVGAVTVDETKLADVTPRFGGYVERLYVDATGQRVRQGQPLMDIYSPELVAAEQELLVAGKLQQSIGESSVPGVPAASTDLVAAAKRRFALWDISEAQVDEILRSGKVRRTLTLYAPASGIVLEKHVVEGQAIQPGEMLYRIANLSDVWIDVALREQDAGAVRVGSHAAVELASYPGRPVDGRVAYVYPTLDQAARTVRARVEVPNSDERLKPGMYATVTLTTSARRALTVPTSAVLNTGERTLVFMDMGGGRLMPMDLVTGRMSGAYTEVLSGLEPGQRVVTSAQYLLDSESNLAEVMKSMMGQMNMSDMKNMGDMKGMPGMDMSGGATGGGVQGMPMPSSGAGDMTDKGADMKGMPMPPAVRPDSATTGTHGKDSIRGMKMPRERR
ncbi:MAG TPA: efflux RND transporter periplasmic adaptor subunit [Gemmatimonadaceae bacterium]|nr:efflux RND transporter periplasmic adaptor subunit [Gemmatimonadaceae bacterium]